MTGEDSLIAWLRDRVDGLGWKLIGDDAASLPPAKYQVTVDTQIAGVHFAADTEPELVARRLLAVNLSDLAAMGARPAYAFLALSAPRGFPHRPFFGALIEACSQFGVELAGGDLSRQPRLTAALTLLGVPHGRVLRRDQASSGEQLWLGGPVGLSTLGCRLVLKGARLQGGLVTLPKILGLPASLRQVAKRAIRRHLEPAPQLELGRWLARRDGGAAIDLSDGLSRDLHRLCRESGVGARLDASALESSKELALLATRLGTSWRDAALAGGEDYVLLFSLPEHLAPPESFGCRRIGVLTDEPAIQLREPDGRLVDLPPAGWDHLEVET